MAGSTIKGITVEIDGNTTKLGAALESVDKKIRSTKSELKEVDKLLKFNPGNTELLAQKQQLLAQAAEQTRERLEMLTRAMEQNGDSMPEDKYRELQRQIIATSGQLEYYESAAEEAANASETLGDDVTDAGDSADGAGDDIEEAGQQTEEAGQAAENSSDGWSVLGQIIADLAKDAIKKAIDGLKELGQFLKTSVQDSAAFADEVLTLSTVTGLATDTIQEMKYSAELLDTDFETVQGSLRKLTQNMRNARDGNEGLTAAFEALGVSIKDDVTGELRPAQDVFYDAIDALGRIENSTERDAAAMEIFGRSAQDLNPLIAAGSDGIKAFADEAHNAGAVMDGEALGALGAMDDSFQRLDQSVQVAQRNLALALAPAITAVAETFSQMAADADWQDIFSSVADGVSEILPDLTSLAKTLLPAILSVVKQVLPYVVQIFTGTDFKPLLDGVIQFLSVATPILAQHAADILPALIDFLTASLPALTTLLQILEPLIQLLGPVLSVILEALSFAISGITELLQNTVVPAIGKTSGAVESARATMQKWTEGIATARTNISTYFAQIRDGSVGAVSTMTSTITAKFTSIKDAAAAKFQEIKEKITKPINDAKAAVENVINTMKSKFSGLSFSLPHIKMPHLSVSGTWSFNPPRVPSFSVRWYKDAMANGMILNGATIFGQMGGKLLGGGEAGPEAIVGVSSLRQMIRDAVGTTNNNTNYDYGGVNVVVYGAPGQNVTELADIIEDRINANIARRRAAF